jgi:DNA-binding response OmpR family regulator
MNGSRILVVDDDADIRGLVKELLERSGALVREAGNGKEALRMLYDARPELIILDISMPEMDGWQTLERIREMTDVPVVMLTAREGELEAVRGLKAGADDYIRKPFSPKELVSRLAELLG